MPKRINSIDEQLKEDVLLLKVKDSSIIYPIHINFSVV